MSCVVPGTSHSILFLLFTNYNKHLNQKKSCQINIFEVLGLKIPNPQSTNNWELKIWSKITVSNYLFKGCRSGYHSSKRPERVSSQIFPKDPGRRHQWIKAIPRKDWSPGKRAVVCSLHFEDTDFKVGREDTNKRRKLGNLRIRCLKDDAVPRIFPNLPSYLTRHRPKERPSISTSASRFKVMELKVNEEAENFLRADKISTFEELKISEAFNFPSSWNVVSHEISDRIIFDEIALNEDGKPTFKFSLTVQQNLQVMMFAKNIMIPVKSILHICKSGKIEHLSDVTNIIAFLNSFADSPCPIEDTLEDYTSRLE